MSLAVSPEVIRVRYDFNARQIRLRVQAALDEGRRVNVIAEEPGAATLVFTVRPAFDGTFLLIPTTLFANRMRSSDAAVAQGVAALMQFFQR